MTEKCYTDEHNNYIISFLLPSLLTFSIILPGIMLLILMNNRLKLNCINLKKKYGFLY